MKVWDILFREYKRKKEGGERKKGGKSGVWSMQEKLSEKNKHTLTPQITKVAEKYELVKF